MSGAGGVSGAGGCLERVGRLEASLTLRCTLKPQLGKAERAASVQQPLNSIGNHYDDDEKAPGHSHRRSCRSEASA